MDKIRLTGGDTTKVLILLKLILLSTSKLREVDI